MKLRCLPLACALAALAAAASAHPAPPQHPKLLRAQQLDLPGQWGADLSPDGRTVAVAIQRKTNPGGTARENPSVDIFVDAEVWDVRTRQRLAHRSLAHRTLLDITTAEWGQVRYTGDGQALLIYDGELLHVLKVPSLEEITRIDLGLPTRPRQAQVVDLAVPRNSRRQAAVLVSHGSGQGGIVRVYNLETGALQRSWSFDRGYPEFGGRLAWSPDGSKLAVTLLPVLPTQRMPREEKNVAVFDPKSGNVLLRFNSGYMAGPVAFAADNRLLTATSEMPWLAASGTHTIKVWDAATGRLIRQIPSPANGVRSSLEVSADGRRILGYVGREAEQDFMPDPESTLAILEQQFRVWELSSGRVVATSPPIQPNPPKRPQLRLSAKGDFVLVFWRYSDKPLLVYEVP